MIILVTFLISIQSLVFAQNEQKPVSTNIKTVTLLNPNDSLKIDTTTIAFGTFIVRNISPSDYSFNYITNVLSWKKRPALDSIQLSYRTLPINLWGSYYHKSATIMDSDYVFQIYKPQEELINQQYVAFNTINYSGSYGRSLALGNGQDVSLNSNFNLQLDGYILDSVRIQASITDNTMPIQPDGTTQQIQEFDQLFITFEKNKHKLTAGDYNIDKPNSYFLNYYKRVQGLQYEGELKNKKKNIISNHRVSGSIAKGQFVKNNFNGQEGNQGPYKLTGNNGEQFFIVLANTEKVYIDGILLMRGENRDYIIDYNTAEIKFMPRILINKDKRIQIEFEYQDRNYLNSLFIVNEHLQLGQKLQVQFNAYSNQDAKNQPYLQNFDEQQKAFLSSIGDNIDQAFYKKITPDTFASNKVLYKIIDTLVNGINYDSILVYSTHPDSAQFNAGFSYVGELKGNYIISDYNTNGRSYQWIAPLDGIPQGNYEPLSFLITPKKHQVFTIAAQYQIDSLKVINVEFAGSNYAPNLYSKQNNNEHWGWAGRFSYSDIRHFGKTDSLNHLKKWVWQNKISYEHVHEKFKEIAPYRNIEFQRDWNIDDTVQSAESILSYLTQLSYSKQAKLSYQFDYFQRATYYNAHKHIAQLKIDKKSWRLQALWNTMESKSAIDHGLFNRPAIVLEKDFSLLKKITLGAAYSIENNQIRDVANQNLRPNSFAFDLLSLYIKSEENEKIQIGFNYTRRSENRVKDNAFQFDNISHTVELNSTIHIAQHHTISIIGGVRSLNGKNIVQDEQAEGQSLVGRVTYSGNFKNGFIVPSLMYELGSGQEQKREFTFIEVANGQGLYYWIDYNEDGVQQANEFELGIYPDQKKYIKILTPTNEYVKVNYINLNLAINIQPENLWSGTPPHLIQKLLQKFSNQLALQINNKSLFQAGFNIFNPFTNQIKDDDIIANLSSWSNTVYFNRNSTKWGTEYTISKNTNKSLLTYGVEGSGQTRHINRWRINLNKQFTSLLQLQWSEKYYNSALPNDERTYLIQGWTAEPSLTWLKKSSFRLTSGYKFEIRENNHLPGKEKAKVHSGNLDLRVNFRKTGSIQTRFTYTNINYNAPINTPIAFTMLDALQKGNNFLWSAQWERSLGNGLEVSLEYEGRKPGDQNIIHTGRMTIRAIL